MTVPARIVVRAPNWIGDVVLSLPALRDLRRNFPDARLTVLGRAWVGDLYRAVSEVDDVRLSAGTRADAAAMRDAFDAAVLFTNSFGTALAARLAGIPERWGYATEGRSPLLTRAARISSEVRGRNQVYYYRAMIAGVGLNVTAAPDARLACPPEWAEAGARRLPGDGPWIGVNPGAFYGGAKRWLPERFAAVADRAVRETGGRVALVGGAAERQIAAAVTAALATPPLDLVGETTLPELVGVLSKLRLLLTNDSGPMHLASALGTPLVAVFGATDWRETAPARGTHAVVREPVGCAPCMLRECPIDHRCMTRVDVDRVAAAARQVLQATT